MTSGRLSVGSLYSTSRDPVGTYKGIVTHVSSDTLTVNIPRLFPSPMSGIRYYGKQPRVGDVVWAMFVEGHVGHPMVFTDPDNIESASASQNMGFSGVARSASDSGSPTGAIIPWAGLASSPIPLGWLLCDGSAVSRTQYADLFSLISTTYGSGNGTTTFNLPDLRGRIPLGLDNMGGSSANRLTEAAADLVGGSGGADTHTLIASEMPSHTHTGPSHTHTGPSHTHTGPSHTHTGPSHTHTFAHGHTISHDHAAFTSAGESGHVHNPPTGKTVYITGDSGGGEARVPTSLSVPPNTGVWNSNSSTGPSTGHTHSINVPAFSGWSGGASPGSTSSSGTGTTGASGTGLTGAGGTGATSASGTGATGSSGGDVPHSIVQPYMAIHYLIKL